MKGPTRRLAAGGWAGRLRLIVLAVMVIGCGPAPTPSPSPSLTALATPSPEATPTPRPTSTPRPSPTPESTGAATRPFTVLLLGADKERRTDSVLVAGVDPVGRSIAFASIPRDTINIPLPDGSTYTNQKINTFYNHAAAHPETYPQGPGRATADAVGTLLGIKIDYFALTTFTGFKEVIEAMGGVEITLPHAVVDPYYEYATDRYGISFPAGKQTLNPERALIYVRTRKADNDFERQRRQQFFLLAVARQMLANPALWPAILGATRNFETDFPLTEGPALIAVLGNLDDMRIRQVVLGPRTYESNASCPCGYALAPKVAAMRDLAADFFPWAVPGDPAVP